MRFTTTFLVGLLLTSAVGLGHAPGIVVVSPAVDAAPTLDGVLAPGEWSGAATLPFTIATVSGTFYVMHDSTYLYAAGVITDPFVGLNSFQLIFDNDHDGIAEVGDDTLVVNLGVNSGGDDYFSGTFYLFDPDDGGTNDINSGGVYAGGAATFELRHPLCSSDAAHDFCLSPGSVIGFNIVYQSGNGAFYAGFPSSDPFNTLNFGDLVIGGPACSPIVISEAAASPDRLWPPNHKMVGVTVNYAVASSCPATCTLGVISNEPSDGTSDGGTSPDWVIVDANHVQLRSERAGTGTGRVYTITITCTNSAGLSSSKAVTVLLPHDRL